MDDAPKRVLVISNMFPPHVLGGYELLCSDVCNSLSRRGYDVRVLTSTFGLEGTLKAREVEDSGNVRVERSLVLESDIEGYRPARAITQPYLRRKNIQSVRRAVQEYRPDVVFVWGMWLLTRAILEELEETIPSRMAYFLSSDWPIEPNEHRHFWELPGRSRSGHVLRTMLKPLARLWLHDEWRQVRLDLLHSACCSRTLRDVLLRGGAPVSESRIIYNGIDLTPYAEHAEVRSHRVSESSRTKKLRLAFVGTLAPHKGVHVLIDALGHVPAELRDGLELTILGRGVSGYVRSLHDAVAKHGLNDRVHFREPIARANLPEFLLKHDVLVLPSLWEEPLALIMEEAMASGMPVIGSATGGTQEMIVHGANGFLFPAGDTAALTEHITALVQDPQSVAVLSAAASETATHSFDFDRMADALEAFLGELIGGEDALTPRKGDAA